jgi:hypothetical protein
MNSSAGEDSAKSAYFNVVKLLMQPIDVPNADRLHSASFIPTEAVWPRRSLRKDAAAQGQRTQTHQCQGSGGRFGNAADRGRRAEILLPD